MNRFFLPVAVLASGLLVVTPLVGNAAPPPAPAVDATQLPPAPVASSRVAFADEVQGRRLLFAARDYYQSAGAKGVDFTVKSILISTNGPAQPRTVDRITETVLAYLPERRASITTETNVVRANRTRRIVRKTISDGQNLIATRFDSGNVSPTGVSDAPPLREVTRLSVDEGVPLIRLFGVAGFGPFSQGALFTVSPAMPLAPQVRIAYLVPGGNSATDTICENDTDTGDANAPVRRARRTTLDKATHRIVRFEEWVTRQTPDRPARKNIPADDGLRVQYRRDDYSYLANGDVTARAKTAYAQNLPADYVEKLAANAPTPPTQATVQADPKALATLARYQRSWERFLSYSAQVEVTYQSDARTAQSRPLPDEWRKSGVRYSEIVLRRPDNRARIVQEPLLTANRWRGPRTLHIVSDGNQVRGVWDNDATHRNPVGQTQQTRTLPLNDPRQLWQRVNQTGYENPIGALGGLLWVFTLPVNADTMDTAAYNGQATLDGGEVVDVVTFTKTNLSTNRRTNQQDKTVTTWRVGFGATDGLPRLIEARRITNQGGRFERDQPPTLSVTTRLRRVQIDAEPSSSAFVLPPAPPKS